MLSRFNSVQLCDPVDCSPSGFSARGILQERILEWLAMPSSRGLADPGIKPMFLPISCIGRWVFTTSATWGACLIRNYFKRLYLETGMLNKCREFNKYLFKPFSLAWLKHLSLICSIRHSMF